MKTYPVELEVAGPAAMWARPDSGDVAVSYSAPTPSAIVGMLNAVARIETARYVPREVWVCSSPRRMLWSCNYGGPLKKSGASNYQQRQVILRDIRYVVRADVEGVARYGAQTPTRTAHYLADKFRRRLRKGQVFETPCLGQSEFLPSYFGPPRPDALPCEGVWEPIPSMLASVFDESSRVAPRYHHNLMIEAGVLRFPASQRSAASDA